MFKKNLNLIPAFGSEEMKAKHSNNLEQWKLFARRFQKNPFVQSMVLSRDNEKCQFCGYKLSIAKNFHVHHIDYDHVCKFGKVISIPQPSEKRPNRSFNGPNCELCHKEMPNLFSECIKRVVLVHPLCNKEIEESRSANDYSE